ncbi:membrane protein [Bacillus sp. JCM 19045]|nr:membrane protein [Bacillus sp. JCM 19045]
MSWLLLAVWIFFFRPNGIELALGFAVMIIVPLTMRILLRHSNTSTRFYDQMLKKLNEWIICFSIAGLLALSLSEVWLALGFALIWVVATVVIALYGFSQLALKGFRDAEEVLIYIGCIYLAVGGGWFLLSIGKASSFLHYSQTIIDLTAVHFHYSAFVLPIVCGMLGRSLRRMGSSMKSFPLLATGIIAGPILVALGIELGPPVEPTLVLVYIFFVFWFALITIAYGLSLKGFKRVGLILSSLILMTTMVLSYLYSAGLAWAPVLLTIPDMVRYHGMANAFGFALIALWTWNALAPKNLHSVPLVPVSSLRGAKYVQDKLLVNASVKQTDALIDSWETYTNKHFDSTKLAPLVAEFHEQTHLFTMEAEVQWHKPFKWVQKPIRLLTKKMKQLHIPTHHAAMDGMIYTVLDDMNGTPQSNVWIRRTKEGEPIFTAAYSSHIREGIRYNNIGLPLPGGIMTGVLMPKNDEHNGLLLLGDGGSGDAGVYLSFGSFTMRTPIEETLHLTQVNSTTLRANHRLKVLGLSFVTLDYTIIKN